MPLELILEVAGSPVTNSRKVKLDFLFGVTLLLLTFAMSCYRLSHRRLIAS